MRGKIIFKYGTMGSGKSLHLLATAHNFQVHSIPFLIFKSEIDTRDGRGIIHSRAMDDRECVSITPETDVYKVVASYISNVSALGDEPLRWILVDEAQFLTKEQVEGFAAIADSFGISIICYGLRTDFRTNLFEGSKRLFEIADSFEEIKSSCYCNCKTIFNARVNNVREVIVDGEQVDIGGDDKYVSMCRKCYFEKTNHPLYQKNKNNIE